MSTMLSFNEIRRKCLAAKKLYKDPDFQPSEKILRQKNVQWCRPGEICSDPKFVVDGFSRFDVNQGSLGDCWFLAALATLTQNKTRFHKVVPMDNEFGKTYAGVFHFWFWKHGEWVEVIIDDRLPVRAGKLLLIKAPKSEFWAALLEKAYAKLYGSYDAIEGGVPSEAMVDFTGGVAERFQIRLASQNIFKILMKANERGSLITTSKMRNQGKDDSKGLYGGHAYSITKANVIKMHDRAIQIVRIRNPWGDGSEWNGAFGDKSSEWSRISKMELSRLRVRFEDDGEFYMTYDDFLRYFDFVDLCHWGPDALEPQVSLEKKWCEDFYHGQWHRGSAFNPQVIVKLVDPDEDDDDDLCTIIVNLSSKNRRQLRLGHLQIKFDIFKIDDGRNKIGSRVGGHELAHYRDVLARFRLLPGYYAIVPSAASNEGGEFMLRVITEATHKQEKVIVKVHDDYSKKQIEFSQSPTEAVIELPMSSQLEPPTRRKNETCLFISIGLISLLAFMFIYIGLLPKEPKNFLPKF